MNDIRSALDRLRESVIPDRGEQEAFERLRQRKDRRGAHRRVGAALTAMVIAIASTGILIRAFDQPDTVVSNPSPLPAVEPHEIVTIPVGPTGQVSAITSGFGGVWVAAYGVPGGKGIDRDAILRLDPATNQVSDTIPVDTVPTWETGGGGLATGFGSLWVAGWTRIDGKEEGSLLRIDPETLEVNAHIPLPAYDGATDVAVNDTAVWVVGRTGDSSGITRVDPETDQITNQTPLRAQSARRVVATSDEVIVSELEWAGGEGPCSVLASVDPTDARLLAEQPRGDCSGGGGIFEWDGEVWVAGSEGFAKVDPATATAVQPVIAYGGRGFPRGDVAVGATGAWFGAYPGGNGEARDTLSRFDPASGLIDTFSLKVGWSAATVLDDTIWAMNFEGTVTRIDLMAAPSPSDGVTDGMVLAEGTAHGTPWTLIVTGADHPSGLELRWSGVAGLDAESIQAEEGLSVAWHTFGRFEPDDAVIFGVVPAEASTVRHVPRQSLPESEAQVIDVPDADWHAFVFSSYAAIGTVAAQDSSGDQIAKLLIVPSGCHLQTVEAFLAARQAGQGAEAFLTPEASNRFGHEGVAPLYVGDNGGTYVNSAVLFLDGPYGDPAVCEVGVRMVPFDGTAAEDTLLVYGDKAAGPRIGVSRPGVDGP